MRDELLRVTGAIVIGLVIILGTLAAVQMLSVSPLWGESGAAWTQAIGSIAAIFGAYHIGDRHAKLERADRVDSVVAICEAAIDRVELVARIFTTTDEAYKRRYFDFDITQIDGVLRAMSSIPFHELGNPTAVVAILELQDQLQFMRHCIAKFDDPVDFHGATGTREKMQIAQAAWQAKRNNILNHVIAARMRYARLKDSLNAG